MSKTFKMAMIQSAKHVRGQSLGLRKTNKQTNKQTNTQTNKQT